jgi:hypothetical protein
LPMAVAEPHRELMSLAIEHDGEAHRALLAGDGGRARAEFAAAAVRYRESWEAAPPTSYGRLVGMLKSSILSGAGDAEAVYARDALAGALEDSPTAAYALALCALVEGRDAEAGAYADRMRGGSEAFARAADAVGALAAGDRDAYAKAIAEIVSDFERRDVHLTGVAIADTAMMLEVLAARRGISAGVESELFPAL